MPNIIKLLPEYLSNQIAAGEVVQRPSSVVKEMLENSVDAKANSIKLIIKDAGRTLIQIIDDGCGMSEIDARMCFEKHATSKLFNSEDLFNIRTMGFRGEAMASIAAISHIELETSDGTAEVGTRLIVEGSKVKSQTPIVTSKGTKISVSNLFFNIPARRNFLKSNSIENKHIIEEFFRVTLAHHSINFQIIIENKELYNLQSNKLIHRIVDVFGNSYKDQFIACNQDSKIVKISGYIGKPEYAKRSRGGQYMYVNNRFIKNNTLNQAIKEGYGRLLPDETFPFYVLFIEILPSLVDINVHPSKTEVKFEDESLIYSALVSIVRKTLSVNQIAPALDFGTDTNFDINAHTEEKKNHSFAGGREMHKYEGEYENFIVSSRIEAVSDWDNLIKSSINIESFAKESVISEELIAAKPEKSIVSNNKRILQLFEDYILMSTRSSVLIIDKSRAYFRIIFEQYERKKSIESPAKQRMIFPLQIDLTISETQIMQEHSHLLENIGLEISFVENSLLIHALPSFLNETEIESAVFKIINSITNLEETKKIQNSTIINVQSAKTLATKIKSSLSEEEMISIVDRLFACENSNYTPDGDKIFVSLQHSDIDAYFDV